MHINALTAKAHTCLTVSCGDDSHSPFSATLCSLPTTSSKFITEAIVLSAFHHMTKIESRSHHHNPTQLAKAPRENLPSCIPFLNNFEQRIGVTYWHWKIVQRWSKLCTFMRLHHVQFSIFSPRHGVAAVVSAPLRVSSAISTFKMMMSSPWIFRRVQYPCWSYRASAKSNSWYGLKPTSVLFPCIIFLADTPSDQTIRSVLSFICYFVRHSKLFSLVSLASATHDIIYAFVVTAMMG